MRTIKSIAAVALLCGGFYAGRCYEASYGQAKEDASKMSDFIRCYDDMASDTLFMELQDEFLDNVKLDSYTYCY